MRSSTIYLITFIVGITIICDVNLVHRVKNNQISSKNMTKSEEDMKVYQPQILSCFNNPICNITTKKLMSDHIDFYIYHPVAVFINRELNLSEVDKKFPYASIADAITLIHVIIGLIGCAFIASEKLRLRRAGVLLFEFAIFLDCLDGVVTQSKDEIGETSSMGYFVDGFCDVVIVGFLIMSIKDLLYQKKFLPFTSKESINVEVPVTLLYFVLNIIFSAFFWNLFLVHFEPLFVKYGGDFLRSWSFLTVAFLWKFCSCYSILHFTMLAIYYNKLWIFLKKTMLLIMALIFIASIIGELILISE